MRSQYGYGDDRQVSQLWDILKGDTLLRVSDGDYEGLTTIGENGKKVVTIGGLQAGMDFSKMSFEDQMRLGIVLGHEAYRDGIVTDDTYLNTRTATMAHTQMAIRMLGDGHYGILNDNLLKDINAYSQGADYFNAYVDANYDSSADYWRLTREGNLEYDGFATLRDADGNVLKSFRAMGLSSDTLIEGAFLWLLNIDKNDTESVNAARRIMEKSGLEHSYNTNPDNWIWRGIQEVEEMSKSSLPTTSIINLTDANMGKTIDINNIALLFSSINASGNQTKTSIERIYGSAIGFLNYADTGGSTTIANTMLSNYYNPAQMAMIHENQIWLNNALQNGINIDGMITGNARRTQEFDRSSGDLYLKTSSIEGAQYFREIHTGIDYGSGGTSILTPGGYWELTRTDDHRAYYQLFGSDINMRIMHLDPVDLNSIALNTIFGNNEKLINYPTSSFGSGTGPHIHIDITKNLPYNGVYQRQFVNPETLQPGSRLEYSYASMDINKNIISGNFGNFNRYYYPSLK